jgi:ABC-type Fe3+ transport system permease subunit
MPTSPPPRRNRIARQPLSARAVGDRWWAASGVAAVAFFALGLIFADLLASPGFPAYNASLARIHAFFIDDRAEAIGISVCHTLSAASLLVFVAYLHEWLRDRTETRLATLAVGGGVAGSAFLLIGHPSCCLDRRRERARVLLALVGGPARPGGGEVPRSGDRT